MSLTTLDPTCALILIDLQQGLAAYPTVHPLAEVARRAGQLADAFRRRGLPVVLVNVAGGAPGRADQPRTLAGMPPPAFLEPLPELGQQPGDLLVTKRTWGAFTGTGLAASLEQRGVTQVVLGGVSTSIGVESTARQAHELGLNVTLAIDAMTDTGAESHQHSLTRIFPRLGETGTTAQLLELLERTHP